MTADTPVSYTVDNSIATVTLDHPPLNLIDANLIDGLIAALENARDDQDIRAVIVTTAHDKAFSAGLDLHKVLDGGSPVMRALLQRLYVDLFDVQHDLGKPSIAAIKGLARGGGMTIALSCNVVLASDTTSFGYPELNVGILPGIHFTHLPRVVGRHKAFELLFSADPFDASQALALGLINHAYPADDLMARAWAMADGFAGKPAGAMAIARDNFMRINDKDYRSEIAGIVDTMSAMIDSDETRDALQQFLGRHKTRP